MVELGWTVSSGEEREREREEPSFYDGLQYLVWRSSAGQSGFERSNKETVWVAKMRKGAMGRRFVAPNKEGTGEALETKGESRKVELMGEVGLILLNNGVLEVAVVGACPSWSGKQRLSNGES